MNESKSQEIPYAFVWRKLHSFTGLWLVGFVIFHLLTNSQAALFIGDDGSGFIRAVNSIHELPYLPLIELAILGIPILIHGIWGILYLRQAKYNSFGNSGAAPYLPEYPRNHAYTWQRITSWLLLVGIIAHVVHMRVIQYPVTATNGFTDKGLENSYMVRISQDSGLYDLSKRLGVELYDTNRIQIAENDTAKAAATTTSISKDPSSKDTLAVQKQQIHAKWLQALQKRPLHDGEVIAVADNFGTAELLMVRDTFKSPVMIALYTLFVLATCFHAFNGLWTAMIAWGITLSARSQNLMRTLSTALMIIVAFLGLSAIWLTYWINLK